MQIVRDTIWVMDKVPNSVYWEGPSHYHVEKSGDWFWILGILAIAGSAASFIVGNVLFGVVIILAAVTLFIVGHQKPRDVAFEVSARGVRIGLTAFAIRPDRLIEDFAGCSPALSGKVRLVSRANRTIYPHPICKRRI